MREPGILLGLGGGGHYGLQGAPIAGAGQIHEGYTSLPSPAAGRECLLVWRMPLRVARRFLDKDAANRQASFLFLGPFSSCAMVDPQKQTELQAQNSPKLLDQIPDY